MTDNRFSDATLERMAPVATSGFLIMPVPLQEAAPVSPMQWLYQQMYEQAMRANQQPKTRELFAIMN
jgi:hypothetical protein